MSGEEKAVTAIRAMLGIEGEPEIITVRDLAERIGRCPEMVVALMELAVRQRWEIESMKDLKGPIYPSYNLDDEVRRFERNEIVATLEACGGVVCRAAKELGLPTSTLRYKMRAYGIRRVYDSDGEMEGRAACEATG